MVARVLAGIALSFSVSACATVAFVRPVDVATPAPAESDALARANATCDSRQSYSGSLGLTGKLGTRRIPGLASAVLYVVVTRDGQVGLEAQVSSQRVFRLGGTAPRATLFLPADARVVVDRADEIVDALIGVRLGPERLFGILGGCASAGVGPGIVERVGEALRVRTSGATTFLLRTAGQWRPVAVDFDDLSVDYQEWKDGLPRRVLLRSRDRAGRPAALTLTVKSAELDAPIRVSAFQVNVPEGTLPMSIDELRSTGPLTP